MKIAVWGAGAIGSGLAYRLTTASFTSELYWINRTYEKIQGRVIDIEHGLAFAPACWRATATSQENAARVLDEVEMLVLTLGDPVPPEKSREDVYRKNRDICRSSVIPALARSFKGIVLVITNPVDLIARLIQKESGLPHKRVLGLGTIVETARLRKSLGSYLSPQRPAREVWAYAVGTHDKNFIPVVMPEFAMGIAMDPAERDDILDSARREVVLGAKRVKADKKSTLHPIIEGAVQVLEAIALDRHSILTISVQDSDTEEGLYCSFPCTVGNDGLIEKHLDLLQDSEIQKALTSCHEGLRTTLRKAGDL